jgi:hypothetical protein
VADYLFVRLADPAGAPLVEVGVDLFDADPSVGPARLLAEGTTTAPSGEARLSWPSDPNLRTGFVLPRIVTAAPRAFVAARGAPEPLLARLPELGAVEVRALAEDGEAYAGSLEVRVLVAEADPPVHPALRARGVRRSQEGLARFPFVETGTLLVVEGAASEEGVRVAPLVAEGPAAAGASVALKLRTFVRDAAPAGVRVFDAGLGPPPAKPSEPTEGERSLILRPAPRAATPAWPLVLEVVCEPRRRGGAGGSARVDEKGAARLNLPPGRYGVRYRLWRATAVGWLAADVGGRKPADLDVPAGEEADLPLSLDRTALESAAGLLWGY